MSERRNRHMAVLMSDTLRAALSHAAANRHTTSSEYIRQALLDRLKADRIEPTTSTTSTSTSTSPSTAAQVA